MNEKTNSTNMSFQAVSDAELPAVSGGVAPAAVAAAGTVAVCGAGIAYHGVRWAYWSLRNAFGK